MQARIPVSTYRLQFKHDFTFDDARALVEYFRELGITDCYSSPILKARALSPHGYDIVDHSQVNAELGGEASFIEFARALRERGMGLLMDVVPNHMCIASSENVWWQDLLENGPASSFARYFDIDWNPPNPSLKSRVLLPILGDQFGRVLENQELRVSYRDGAFHLSYWETQLPISPRASVIIVRSALDSAHAMLDETHPHLLELESIINALTHLPRRTDTDPARMRERVREKEVVRRRLSALVKENNEVRAAIHEAVMRVNGVKGRPESFDRLEELLNEQAYRLSFWRVASDEINYRRFFDVNELAAVRVEERAVFAAVHEVVFRLMRQGLVTGLRVDHVDGLLDPSKYLADLQREASSSRRARKEMPRAPSTEGEARVETEASSERRQPFYVVVEKILGHDELLRREWPVEGTTGYDFMNLLNGLFVETRNAQAFHELYGEFTGDHVKFSELVYESKHLILRAAMSSELHVLARRLSRIAAQHRYSRDFTPDGLLQAITETIACFPVYRSYARRAQNSISPDDRLNINAAIAAAKRRNPAQDPSIFDFIGALLMLKDPKGTVPADRAERRDFALRFQQLTSPVTAKGIEDTAFYRFYPLSSLNEVGGEPAIFGTSIERFHQRNQDRQDSWPHTLVATATHDTKRGEDTRTRIDVLSEIPEEWNLALYRWREMNRARKSSVDGARAPDANEEYLIYQTLVGTWPLAESDEDVRAGFVRRVQEYMHKALKEAKVHTSWINQNDSYERAVSDFVAAILKPSGDNAFLSDFEEFQRLPARAGMLNSLAQTLLKTTVPGVPDFYQGTELWDYTLVDPDNRRPVDYELRRALLERLRDAETAGTKSFIEGLLAHPEDGRVKLFVTSRALNFRRAHAELFAHGSYEPLRASGRRAESVVAFARSHEAAKAIVVAGRFFTRLGVGRAGSLAVGAQVWGDTRLAIEERDGETIGERGGEIYRDLFTGREFETEDGTLAVADVLSPMPVALLERTDLR